MNVSKLLARRAQVFLSFVIFHFMSVSSALAQEAADKLSPVAFLKDEAMTVRKIMDWLIEMGVKYSFQVLGGLIVLAAGWILGRFVSKLVHRNLVKYHVDVTVAKFVAGASSLVILAFAGLIALGKFGVEIAPLIAGLSVIGFGTSFALQGPLSNYAAGITLIFTKPFKVGDIIDVIGQEGEVQDISLARTILKTVDGTLTIIPNKHIVGEVIHNFSMMKRVDLKLGVSYGTDIDKAIAVIKNVVLADPRVTQTPSPRIGISEFGDSSVNIYARLWCQQADYWDVLFALNRDIFAAFKNNGIEIPFPQRDVHIIEHKK